MEQNSILDDILDGSGGKKNKTSSIFNTYKPKEQIGNDIYRDFIKFGLSKDNIFALSDVNQDTGLISISQGLITIALVKQFTSDAKGKEVFSSEEIDIFNRNLTAFFNEVGYFTGALVYRATPYVKNFSFDYVDSLAKCIQAIMEIRELILTSLQNKKPLNLFVEGIGSDLEIVDALVFVLKDCLKKLCDLKIICPSGEHQIGNVKSIYTSCGWNYTNDLTIENNPLRPSLYFTYSVCLAYMSIYENIELSLGYIRSEDKEKYIDEKINDKNKAKFERDILFYQAIEKEYQDFKGSVASAGLYLDLKLSGLDLRSKFLGIDYNAVDLDEIKGSTTNNAIFNTLFSVVILIASGVSDIYNDNYQERRYFEWLQSIMQNIYDTYCEINLIQKGYIIDQYVLNFNETIPVELYDQVNYLRKQRIQVLTVVPLMVRAYNMVSKWVTRYPQKQMINYLELIMSNRYKDSNGVKWVWDKDGYDVNINSIYISALYDFYAYYEEYEFPLNSSKKTVASVIEKYSVEIEELNERIKEGQVAISKQAEEHAVELNKLKKEYEEKTENLPIISAIKELILNVLQEQLIKLLPEIFERVTIYLCSRDETEEYSITNEKNKETAESKFAYKFIKFITAYFSNEIYSLIDKDFEGKDSVSKAKENSKLHMNDRYIKLIDSLIRKLGNQISNKFKEI